jgi:hypothetical protein
MAANLALSDARVTDPSGQVIEHAHVLARDNRLRIRAEGIPDILVVGIDAVESAGRDQWRIVTSAGVFVSETKGCGCS